MYKYELSFFTYGHRSNCYKTFTLRDLKPCNIFVDTRGNCRLGDFGHAVVLDDSGFGGICGTLGYQSPEVSALGLGVKNFVPKMLQILIGFPLKL